MLASIIAGLFAVTFAVSANADTREFIHSGANLQLSAPVPGLVSVGVKNYDSAGEDKSIGLKGQKYGLALTIYVYPRKALDIIEEFKDALRVIQAIHPDSTVAHAAATNKLVGKVQTRGWLGLVLLAENSNELGSLLLIFPQNDRYVLKVRATYHRNSGEEGEALEYAMESIVAALGRLEPIGK